MKKEVIKISDNTIREIIDGLVEKNLFDNFFSSREKMIDLLSEIFPLEDMKSTDHRCKNAREDLHWHLVFNDDWDMDYLLKERLSFMTLDDTDFINFIEIFISPKYQDKIDNIIFLFNFFSKFISKNNLILLLSGYDNKLPVYKVFLNDDVLKKIPEGVKKNDIKVTVKEKLGFKNGEVVYSQPDTFPSIVLIKDNWDDFGARTLYNLYFHRNKGDFSNIGPVRIMKKGQSETSLPENFLLLDENYCSLGAHVDFYDNLNKESGEDFISILYALRDAAFFPSIYEDFENEKIFKESLIRGDDIEKLSRTAAYIFSGGDEDERFKFRFKFRPLFDKNETEVDFSFTSNGDIKRRIIALIGENGTGKTQLLSTLSKELSNSRSLLFYPRKPLFGKILTVSYNIFDSFEIPKSDNYFNYKYCGLSSSKGGILSREELDIRFSKSLIKIDNKERRKDLLEILKKFIDTDLVNSLEVDSKNESPTVDTFKFLEIKDKLSSGQSIMFYIIVEIMAELRLDSLILFDEPETHLHPSAISKLVSIIYDLVERFDSYCVIATHSPIIVQNLTSDSVYVTKKEEDMFLINKIGRESFGEDLTNITNNIFGNKDVPIEYKRIIDDLVYEEKNYDEIIKVLSSDNVPLSLNAKMYIHAALGNKND